MIRTLLVASLVAILLLTRDGGRVEAQEKDPPADALTPIASSIVEVPTTLDIDGQKVAVTLAYSQQGNTVFVLPVWHVHEVRRLTDGSPAVALKPSDLVFDPALKSPQRLEFDVIDLLTREGAEKAVQDKLKARLAQFRGLPTDQLNPAFAVPLIKPGSHRFTLIGPGRGDDTLPAEVPLSADMQRLTNGRVRDAVLPDALKAVEAENGGPLKLAQAHLRAVGLMRVRFEQTQVLAQVDYVRGAVAEFRKAVGSMKDSQGRTPDVFVELPDGGAVSADSQLRQLAQQSLSVSLAARAGADTAPMMALVQAELNGLLDRAKTQVTDENQRVALLLDRQVGITATLGEIHKLAKQDEKHREAAFNAAFEDYRTRSSGSSSRYSGAVAVNILGYGGVGGGVVRGSTETTEDRTKREMAAARKQFDRVMKEFAGKVPTLTGIRFDDTATAAALEQVARNFKESKLTTGDSLHRWPLVALGGQPPLGLAVPDLAREYAILKADHEELLKLVGTPQRLAEARANMDKLERQSAELQAKLAATEAVLTAFEKKAGATLAKVDQAAVTQLKADVTRLKRRAMLRPLQLTGHTSSVHGVAFSPDGKRVATASDDRTARVWDAATGRELAKLAGDTGAVRGVAFSPDSSRVATAGDSQTVKIWDVD